MKFDSCKNAPPVIHLPIETKSRELDSRCLIALECARRGAMAIVGPAAIFPYQIPHVVLLKSATRFEVKRIRDEKDRGALAAVLDEEGIVHTADRREHAMRFCQESLSLVDRVFLNGANEKSILDQYYKYDSAKCMITGNPRFDLCRSELSEYYTDESVGIVNQYGKFILIPSRFGNVNIARRMGFIEFQEKVRKLDPVTELPMFRDYHNHSKKLFSHFLKLLPLLSNRFPDYSLILRPHPSERHEIWIEAAKSLKNVHVISEGPIGPWLKAAEAIIHNGCTTGLEAFLMGRPVYAYMPIESEVSDLHLPNSVSTKVSSADELFDALEDGLKTGRDCSDFERATRTGYASLHLANAGGEYAFARIADELVALAHSHSGGVRELNTNWRVRASIFVRNLARKLAIRLYRSGIPMPRLFEDVHYSFMKYPGVTLSELTNRICQLAPLIGVAVEDIAVQRLDAVRFCVRIISAGEKS